MTYEELKELKNDTTIVINYLSGRIEVTLFKKELLKEATSVFKARYMFNYMFYGEAVSLDRIRLATKEDIDLYILNKHRKVVQLERELKAGL